MIRYRNHLTKKAIDLGTQLPEHFCAKDIRRTAKNLMIEAGINRECQALKRQHRSGRIFRSRHKPPRNVLRLLAHLNAQCITEFSIHD